MNNNLFADIDHEQEAIEFIVKNCPPEGWFVGFSGGKDSVVLMDLVKRSGCQYEAWYSNTGIDPPEVTRFIKEHYPDVKWARPVKSFFKLIQEKGSPTKFTRWCCDHLKKNPTKNNPLRNRLLGLRAEESSKRAARGRVDQMRHPVKQLIYKPIFHWPEWQIWEYIEAHNLPYCSLYDEGFDRIGCVICPFICGPNQFNLNLHKSRWPKQYRAFEIAMKKLYDTRIKDRGYDTTFEAFLIAWYRGLPSRSKDLPLLEYKCERADLKREGK